MKVSFIRAAVAMSTAVLLFGTSVIVGVGTIASSGIRSADQCPSGKMSVRLTGWSLNGKTPRGEAIFEEASKTWNVTVKFLGLEDGTPLDVFIDDEKLGETAELKSGEVAAAFAVDSLPDADDMLSVNTDDRPVVSGTIKCVESSATNAE